MLKRLWCALLGHRFVPLFEENTNIPRYWYCRKCGKRWECS